MRAGRPTLTLCSISTEIKSDLNVFSPQTPGIEVQDQIPGVL